MSLSKEPESEVRRDECKVAESQDSEEILRYFDYDHLAPRFRDVSTQFAILAYSLCATLPRCAERSVALRKLLEAKDAAVRARLW